MYPTIILFFALIFTFNIIAIIIETCLNKKRNKFLVITVYVSVIFWCWLFYLLHQIEEFI